jgi:hypothetical protein
VIDVYSMIPAFWVVILVCVSAITAICFYALRTKGDVSVEAAYGSGSFRLHAKERPSKKSDKEKVNSGN